MTFVSMKLPLREASAFHKYGKIVLLHRVLSSTKSLITGKETWQVDYCLQTHQAVSSRKIPSSFKWRKSSPPHMYSRIRYNLPPVWKAYMRSTMNGCCKKISVLRIIGNLISDLRLTIPHLPWQLPRCFSQLWYERYLFDFLLWTLFAIPEYRDNQIIYERPHFLQ